MSDTHHNKDRGFSDVRTTESLEIEMLREHITTLQDTLQALLNYNNQFDIQLMLTHPIQHDMWNLTIKYAEDLLDKE